MSNLVFPPEHERFNISVGHFEPVDYINELTNTCSLFHSLVFTAISLYSRNIPEKCEKQFSISSHSKEIKKKVQGCRGLGKRLQRWATTRECTRLSTVIPNLLGGEPNKLGERNR